MSRGIDRRALLAGAAAAACIGAPAVVRAAEPLKVNAVPANAIHWVQLVAVEKGFYKDAGFEPNLSVLQSSPQSIQFILSGELQVATTQPELALRFAGRAAAGRASIGRPMPSVEVGPYEHSLDQARAAAGEKDVSIGGGSSAVQQYLAAGLLDELVISVVPIFLGSGARLFENLGQPKPTIRQVQAIEAPAVTHIRYMRS